MSRKNIPSQERLREVLDYDPLTGKMTWKVATATHVTPGDPAFAYRARDGYLQGGLDGGVHLAHRIVWKLVYGTTPNQVDHIDGDRANNALSNLRDCSISDNNFNKGVRFSSKTGVNGVTIFNGRYRARIRVKGRDISLGCYDTIEEAASARKAAQTQYGFHSNHGQRDSETRKRQRERWGGGRG